MTIRRGRSPRDRGQEPEEPSPSDAAAAGPPPGEPAPGRHDEPAASAVAEPEAPDFLRAAGGSVREGGTLRDGGSVRDRTSIGAAATGGPPRSPRPGVSAPTPRAASPAPPPATPDPYEPASPRRALPPLALPRVSLPRGLGQGASVVGLVIVAALSYALLTGQLPTVAGGGGGGGPIKTPTPSNVVVVDPRANVPGTLVYVKDGNLWLQSGPTARQLTTGGSDAMPAWSLDGQWIYFIRTTPATGRWPTNGEVRTYDLDIPALVRIHPDGTGIETLLSGRIKSGSYLWQSFIRQPSPAPDGKRVAIVTDHPQPWTSDVVLKILNLQSGALTNPQLPEVFPLGHQDPAWSPDGSAIAYVRDARAGTRGTPVIERYDLASKQAKAITGPGYLSPAWSPDGKYLAATKTGSFGTDVVILDARTGAELLRVTNDEASFDPVWSPAGDAVAFFRVDHGVVDLELVRLTGTAPGWGIGDSIALTVSAGLDAASRPSWFIPEDQLPTPAPSAASSGGASAQPFPTLHGSNGGPPSGAPGASGTP